MSMQMTDVEDIKMRRPGEAEAVYIYRKIFKGKDIFSSRTSTQEQNTNK